jgi:hypothetical protein
MTPKLYLREPNDGVGWVIGFAAGVVILLCAMAAPGMEPERTLANVPSNARATVRIKQQVCDTNKCLIGWASGTVIGRMPDRRIAVLSCAHGKTDAKPAEVELVPGTWLEGEVVGLDPRADLSLVAVTYPGRLPCIPLATESPRDGQSVSVKGFPMGESFRERNTRLLRTVSLQGIGPRAVVDSPFIDGESGGTVSVRNAQGESLVGVIVATDSPILPPGVPFMPRRDLNGYTIPWQTTREFVLATAGGPLATETEGGQSEAKPFRRGAQGDAPNPPEASLEPVPTPIQPRRGAAQSPDTPNATEGQPTEIDWSLAKLVVLVPRQESLDKFDTIVRAVEKLSATESGPGKTIRRWIGDITDGKADVEIVYERVEPEKYRDILNVTGLRVGRYAGVVALVKRQDAGILSPLKTIAARIAERAAANRLPDVPVELVLERTSANEFREVNEALVKVEGSPEDGPEGSGGTLEWIMAGVYASIRGVRQAVQHYRGQA